MYVKIVSTNKVCSPHAWVAHDMQLAREIQEDVRSMGFKRVRVVRSSRVEYETAYEDIKNKDKKED